MGRTGVDLQEQTDNPSRGPTGIIESPLTSETPIGLLVLTDDPMLSEKLGRELERLSLDPRWVATYEEALDLGKDDWDPEIVVVDLLIPRAERYTICSVVRSAFGVPVIAVGEEPDVPRAAKLGADGYLTKPISSLSLSTSIRAVLHRKAAFGGPIVAGDLKLDPDTRTAHVDQHRIALSGDEFALLARLAASPEISVSKSELLKVMRGAVTDQWLVDIHVMRLMVKLVERSVCRITRTPGDDGFVLSVAASSASKISKQLSR
jgi:DNA-binding response OmpR family regulator